MDGHGQMSSAPSARVGEITFDRSLAGLTGIAVKGFLLSLITFGIYRFWYMTNLRRFFWSRTLVDGSPGEYTGTGKELFLGFLVAIAILVPIYVGLFAVSVLSDQLAALAGVLSFVVLFVLGQFALYRGRRYRATRTLWRGIRLGQDGSGLAYAARAALWWLLTLLTFGLVFPFMRASLERYRIRHTLVGTSRMESGARGTMVLGNWLLLYAVGLMPILAMTAALWIVNGYEWPLDLYVPKPGAKGALMHNPVYDGTSVGLVAGIMPFLGGVSIAAALLLFPYYRARETRAFMNAARLGDARLISSLRARRFYWPYIAYAGSLILFALVLGLAVALIGLIGYGAGAGAGSFSLWHLLILPVYLGGALVTAVLHVRIVQARLWAAVADSTRVSDADALAAVVASSRAAGSGLSEGLADALDVGGALQIGF